MNTLIVCLGFKARSGKDTLAQLIHQRLPDASKIYHFADALKATARVMFGMKQKDAPLLQILGTDVMRRNNPEIWVDALRYQIEEESYPIALIPDSRFPNEVAFAKDSGGLTIKVERILADGTQYIASDRPADHPSEIALNDYQFDFTISVCDGDLAALEYHADVIAGLLRDLIACRSGKGVAYAE
jgi:hypothetical protein